MTDSAPPDMPGSIPALSLPAPLSQEIQAELRRAALLARSSASRTHGGGGFRARRSQRLYRRFLAISFITLVVMPMIYVGAYLWAIPAQYVTESRLTVVSQGGPMSGVLSSLMGRESSGEAYLMSYVASNNIIADLLQDNLELVEESGVLQENAVAAAITGKVPSLERQLKLWERHVKVNRRSFTSTIGLSVTTLSPQSSLDLHERILDLAEQHINQVSARQRTTQVLEAEEALKSAQVVLGNGIARLQEVRQKYNIIDPQLEAAQRISLIYELEQQQAERRQRLGVLQQRKLDNPQINQLLSQIEALEIQKQDLRQTIAGNAASTGITMAKAASEMALFEAEVDAARAEVARRMIQLSEARQTANRQGTFLQNSVLPVLPQAPQRVPKLLYWIMFLVGAIGIWLAIAAMGALVRDHAR